VFVGFGALAVPSSTTQRLAGRKSGWARRLAALAPNSEEKRGLGFSLAELLIVVAIIGLIATITIPNLVNTIQRSRQTASMADLKVLGRAVSLYAQDYTIYPIEASLISAESLQAALYPYLGDFDATDGWRRPFMYVSNGRDYTLLSYALDGVANLPYTVGPIHRLEMDIVMSNGVFVQWPEGVQY
jgi:general secretion pathway protein G